MKRFEMTGTRESLESNAADWSAKKCLDVFVMANVITVKDFRYCEDGELNCSCRNGYMCLMRGHIAVWNFLQGKTKIPECFFKQKQERVEANVEGDSIAKRKKVKAGIRARANSGVRQ